MEGRAEVLTLHVSAIGWSFADIERTIESGLPIVVMARKPSGEAEALAGSMRPLLTKRDDRSDWRAMRDSWRLRHFAACFGMADKAGYAWRVEETEGLVSVIFQPPASRP